MKEIKYCSEGFLIEYKANFEIDYLPLYRKRNKEKFQEIFKEEDLLEGDFEFNFQELYKISEYPTKSESMRENIKLIYSMFLRLTKIQATEKHLV
ncbi:MAG: hypothetical protein ACK5LM_03585 [Lactovum sp.]